MSWSYGIQQHRVKIREERKEDSTEKALTSSSHPHSHPHSYQINASSGGKHYRSFIDSLNGKKSQNPEKLKHFASFHNDNESFVKLLSDVCVFFSDKYEKYRFFF